MSDYTEKPIDQYDYWFSDHTIGRLKRTALDLGVSWPGDEAFARAPDQLLLDVLSSVDKLLKKVRRFENPTEIQANGDWKTIDSAPKDGTCILLANRNQYAVARFSPQQRNWFSVRGFMPKTPTHWMPIPALLKGKEDE